MHFVVLDAEGYSAGFYALGLSPDIPDAALPLDEDTYRAWIADTAGQRWQDGTLVPAPHRRPVISIEEQAAAARARRDAWLAASDWTQMADAPGGAKQAARWRAYRAALRDVPSQPGFPAAIAWPEAPL